MGDVHGSVEGLRAILERTQLVDAAGSWSGGEARLVLVGDLIDRGPADRAVLDLVMALERQAPGDGGEVVALLGNHEVMNLHGDLRYVAIPSHGGFASAAARAEAFGPRGRYGRWLRARPALVRIGGVVFVHGGVHPGVAARGLRALDRQVHLEIELFDAARDQLVRARAIPRFADVDGVLDAARDALGESAARGLDPAARRRLEPLADYASWLGVHPHGPLWFRGFAKWSDADLAAEVPALLGALDAERFVVGHTPQLGGIRGRVGCRVFLIDTGLLGGEAYPGGEPAALEIEPGRYTAVYLDRREVLLRDGTCRAGSVSPSPGR